MLGGQFRNCVRLYANDVPWREQKVRVKTPLVEQDFALVPDELGVDIEVLVSEAIKPHMHPDHSG